MKYDVAIIGAGPGGVAAAHNLINKKVSCILIDKQKFPRNKLCAGGITYKTFELIKDLKLQGSFNIENAIISEGANLFLEYEYIAEIKAKKPTYLVDRYEFDDYLVKEYKKKGGALLERRRVSEIDTKQKIITLANGEEIEFKYIIGADGASGFTKKLVDKNYSANGFCLQVEVSRDEYTYKSNNMSLYYGVIPQGYGWIFPKKNTLTIGFGGDYDETLDYHEAFEKFLSKIGIDSNRSEFKGAFLPFGEYIKNQINEDKNILLIGDAAGLVDPITGEGIYFAMESGIKASNIIVEALIQNNKEILDKYHEEISNITKNISKGVKMKKFIYKLRRPIFTAMKNKQFGSLIFNECLYESNYNLLEVVFRKN